MQTNFYDVVVVGKNLSDIIVATLCSSRGLRVLLVRPQYHKTTYRLGSHVVPVMPVPLAGCNTPSIQRVFQALNLEHAFRRQLQFPDPLFQLIGPDVRINVTNDETELHSELVRAFGTECIDASLLLADEVSDAWNGIVGSGISLHPTGFWNRRGIARSESSIRALAGKWMENVSQNSTLRSLLCLPAVFDCYTAPDELSDVSIARSFALWSKGAPRLVHDGDSLRELFLEKFANHNGEVRTGEILALRRTWNRVSGMQLDTGEEIGAGHVVFGGPWTVMSELLGSKQPRKLTQHHRVTAGAYRYTLNLVIDHGGIPAGMARTALVVLDPLAPMTNGNAFAVFCGDPSESGEVVVTVVSTALAPQDANSVQDSLADLRVALRQHLETVMPFIAEHVLTVHSPHESIPPEGTQTASELPLVPPVSLWNTPVENHFGVSGVPLTTGIKNLWCSSHQVVPGLGLESAFYTGWSIFNQVMSAAGKAVRNVPARRSA